jgi:hypothetical protein
MVKDKIDDAAGISTDSAASSGLFNKYPLDLLLATRHCFAYAALAGPSPPLTRSTAVKGELGHSMALALP